MPEPREIKPFTIIGATQERADGDFTMRYADPNEPDLPVEDELKKASSVQVSASGSALTTRSVATREQLANAGKASSPFLQRK